VLNSELVEQIVQTPENSENCCSERLKLVTSGRTKNMDVQGATIPLSKCTRLVVQGVLEAKYKAIESAKQIHKKTLQ
jgi:hypothetical protein